MESVPRGDRPVEGRQDAAPPAVLADLAAACGVRFNGDAPWDSRVHDADVYRQILTRGPLGFGESYRDGLWDCAALDELFYRLLKHRIEEKRGGWNCLRLLGDMRRRRFFNLQAPHRAFQVGVEHDGPRVKCVWTVTRRHGKRRSRPSMRARASATRRDSGGLPRV